MSLLAALDAWVATLPPDWSYAETTVELEDLSLFTQANLTMARVNGGRPVGEPEGVYRVRISRSGGRGASLPSVRAAFRALDDAGVPTRLRPAFSWSDRQVAQP